MAGIPAWGARAETFTYDGAPMLTPDAPEEGDCVQRL
jgi:hypothetical protein